LWRGKRTAAVLAALLVKVGIATASTLQSFSIDGTGTTYGDGSFSFAGNMSIDVTTDSLVSLDLNLPYVGSPIELLPGVGDTYHADVECCRIGSAGTVKITMTPDLLGDGFYSGGSLTGSLLPINTATAEMCGQYPQPCDEQITGYTGEVAPTPIPVALPLFATGLGAMALFGWRRKKA
jgi:hypothetical protein